MRRRQTDWYAMLAVAHLQQQLNAFVALSPNSPQRTATGELRYKQLKALLMTSRPEKADAAFFQMLPR